MKKVLISSKSDLNSYGPWLLNLHVPHTPLPSRTKRKHKNPLISRRPRSRPQAKPVALTVLLAVGHKLGPVARVGLLVVEQAADAELLGGRAVPAGPVARAGRLVAEDAVQPVAVLRGDRRVFTGQGGLVSRRTVGKLRANSMIYQLEGVNDWTNI